MANERITESSINKDHLLPSTYMKHFANKNRRVFCFEKGKHLIEQKNITNLLWRRGFTKSIEHVIQPLENVWNICIEGINKKVNALDIHNCICMFFSIQYFRSILPIMEYEVNKKLSLDFKITAITGFPKNEYLELINFLLSRNIVIFSIKGTDEFISSDFPLNNISEVSSYFSWVIPLTSSCAAFFEKNEVNTPQIIYQELFTKECVDMTNLYTVKNSHKIVFGKTRNIVNRYLDADDK